MKHQTNSEITDKNSEEVEFVITPGLKQKIDEFKAYCSLNERKPILVTGPTGAGKSLFLRLFERFHKNKTEGKLNVVKVNCALFSGTDPSLSISAIFGHEKGSHSTAPATKEGHVDRAKDGVLILEEIGDLPAETQAMLLTFIEDNKYFRLGGNKELKANVQIIGATNRPQNLREDLGYRFERFDIPPICNRREDILFLLALNDPGIIGELKPWEVMSLLSYNWPGNVREIQRVGGLIKRKLKQNEMFSTKSGEKNYVINKRFMQSLPFDPSIDKYFYAIVSSSIFNFSEGQTKLDIFLSGQLYNDFENAIENKMSVLPPDSLAYKIYNGRAYELECILNTLHVGLWPNNHLPAFYQYPKNKIKSFWDYKNSQETEFVKFPKLDADALVNEQDNEYGLKEINYDYIYSKAFLDAYKGIILFCQYFYKNIFDNANILKISKAFHSFPSEEIDYLKQYNIADGYNFENIIFEYISGIDLKNRHIPEKLNEHRRYISELTDNNKNNQFLHAITNRDLQKEDTDFWDYDYYTLNKIYFEEVLKKCSGNVTLAEEMTGIKRTSIYVKMDQHEIPVGFGRKTRNIHQDKKTPGLENSEQISD